MKQRLIIPLALIMMLGSAAKGFAHGVKLEHQTTEAIELNAAFDSGEPMADAQVAIYSPTNPTEPWLTGLTDKQGQFLFAPDRSQPGNWEVMIRQAGHGGIVTIPVSAAGVAAGSEEPTSARLAAMEGHALTPLQKTVMAGAVIWGFIGTALFFARGKK